MGDATLTRVPYIDVLVDAEVVGLTPEQVRASPWAQPTWSEGDQVRVGAAVWIIESDGLRIAVDPAQAADHLLRTAPDAARTSRASPRRSSSRATRASRSTPSSRPISTASA